MKRKIEITDPTTSTTDYDIAKKQFGALLARAEVSNDITEALARTLQQEGSECFNKGRLTYTSKAGVTRIMTSFSDKLAKIVKGLT